MLIYLAKSGCPNAQEGKFSISVIILFSKFKFFMNRSGLRSGILVILLLDKLIVLTLKIFSQPVSGKHEIKF